MNARPNAVPNRGTDEILAGYEGIQAGQEAFYKDLHSHPNCPTPSTAPPGASLGKLRDYGFTVQTGIGGTGVTGVLANGSGPSVLLRAELDALPVREDTGAEYASTVTGRFARSEHRGDHALLLSPWPESLLAFEPVWSRLAEHTAAADPHSGADHRRRT